MASRQSQLCDHCRLIASSHEKLKAFTHSDGALLCRGTKQSVERSGCALRQITWACIDEWNAERKSEEATEPLRAGKSFQITDPDPPMYLMAWSGPKSEGKKWFDVDEMDLQYHWGPRGGSSVVGTFDAYALPGTYALSLST